MKGFLYKSDFIFAVSMQIIGRRVARRSRNGVSVRREMTLAA